MCHMSRVMCHLSHVTCHVSIKKKKMDKVVKLVGGESVIIGATPSSLDTSEELFCVQAKADKSS